MRRRGADCPVVVTKRGECSWSEGGTSSPLGASQLATGGAPILDGRRQPSCGGTSRMTRECQVRICEGLGVQFPGPTRQYLTHALQQSEATARAEYFTLPPQQSAIVPLVFPQPAAAGS